MTERLDWVRYDDAHSLIGQAHFAAEWVGDKKQRRTVEQLVRDHLAGYRKSVGYIVINDAKDDFPIPRKHWKSPYLRLTSESGGMASYAAELPYDEYGIRIAGDADTIIDGGGTTLAEVHRLVFGPNPDQLPLDVAGRLYIERGALDELLGGLPARAKRKASGDDELPAVRLQEKVALDWLETDLLPSLEDDKKRPKEKELVALANEHFRKASRRYTHVRAALRGAIKKSDVLPDHWRISGAKCLTSAPMEQISGIV